VISLIDIRKDSITWSVDEAKSLLADAAIRISKDGVEVDINGVWMGLCRTDLMDQVASSRDVDAGDLEATRLYYLQRINYGARKIEWDDNVLFSVIDRLTDG
jgi:hypothetical protein